MRKIPLTPNLTFPAQSAGRGILRGRGGERVSGDGVGPAAGRMLRGRRLAHDPRPPPPPRRLARVRHRDCAQPRLCRRRGGVRGHRPFAGADRRRRAQFRRRRGPGAGLAGAGPGPRARPAAATPTACAARHPGGAGQRRPAAAGHRRHRLGGAAAPARPRSERRRGDHRRGRRRRRRQRRHRRPFRRRPQGRPQHPGRLPAHGRRRPGGARRRRRRRPHPPHRLGLARPGRE